MKRLHDWIRRKFGWRQPPPGTDAWLAEAAGPLKLLPNFYTWAAEQSKMGQNADIDSYLQMIEAELAEGPAIVETGKADADPTNKTVAYLNGRANRFGLRVLPPEAKIEFQGKFVARLVVESASVVRLENCVASELIFKGPGRPSVQIHDCWIGTLHFSPNSVSSLEIEGGGIDKIYCPRPSAENPFLGSVRLKGVWLSPSSDNAQAYRNLRHYMTAMHNLEAASVFHSAEMKSLYEKQHGIDKTFNLMYRAASDYGNSTLRPLIWFLLFTVANFLLFWYTDGALISYGSPDLIGWRSDFAGDAPGRGALRAALITLTQVLNPLGIFGRGFLIPETTPLALANVSLCFAATVSLALFAFALRRRFRISVSVG